MLPSAEVKPQSFAYTTPDSVTDVLELLDRHGPEAAVLAGGQSLVPMMNLRLARPAVLVDINGVAGLDALEVREGQLCVGATVRHHDLEKGQRLDRAGVDVGPLGRLLGDVAGHVGHLPIRIRGTLAGSLAHADPNAEWPVVATALGATLVLAGPSGRRAVAAEDFFDLPFAPARSADEVLLEVRFPVPEPGWGGGFAEFAPTAGAFATAAVCAAARVLDGVVGECRVVAAGLGGRPVRLPAVETAANGGPVEPDALDAAARAASGAAPGHLGALVVALAARALRQAAGRGAAWT
jgi:CO/xanthine dehydrogenase FAD-binding subunit